MKLNCSLVSFEPVVNCADFSSWQRLVRVTAYCFRFIHNARIFTKTGASASKCTLGALQPEELRKVENHWIQIARRDLVDWDTKYRDLTPFMQDGMIRVGGRLQKSALTYEQIYPILLPASHHISHLIMSETHAKFGHAGPERTLGESRRKVWILRGRNLANNVVRKCVICRKLRQPPHNTLMANLPPERMRFFDPPYTVTGVDLFGPFQLKYGRNKSTKAWGGLFTCATVRAIHLEIVDGLSTEAFLHALRRFVSHHGWPTTIMSDNGSSCIGAQKSVRN